jgi:hypothetical protein
LYYSFRHPDTLTTNPFRNVIRCTYYTTHLDTQTHSQAIRLSTSSVVLTTHSDTQTRRHADTTNPFIHVIRCTIRLDTQTQPISLSTSSVVLPPIQTPRHIHKQSVYPRHPLYYPFRHADTTNPFIHVIRCTLCTHYLIDKFVVLFVNNVFYKNLLKIS